MKKAIVVLDRIPENCSDCDLWNDLPSFGEYSQGYRGKCQKTKGLRHSGDGKPLWCPIEITEIVEAIRDDSATGD